MLWHDIIDIINEEEIKAMVCLVSMKVLGALQFTYVYFDSCDMLFNLYGLVAPHVL